MDDIVQFLRARLDEDERTARAATDGPWTIRSLGRHDLSTVVKNNELLAQLDGSRAASNSVHMAVHNPARVLAEVEAKRRRIDLLADAIQRGHDDYDIATELLPLEALPYGDHPDYRNEWRP